MINIGIMFGSRSCEHDISIITAYQIQENLKDDYNLYMLYIDKDFNMYLANKVSLEDFKKNDLSKLKKISFIKGGISHKKTKLESIVIATHGINGEDGMAKAITKFYDIASVGCDIFSSAISLDKANTYYILKNFDISMTKRDIIYKVDDEISFNKFIVKPSKLGSSIGVFVGDKNSYKNELKQSFLLDDKIVVEEFLEDFKEYNIALYKTDSINTSDIYEVVKTNDILTFDDKYLNSNKLGIKILKQESLVKEIKELAIKIYDILNLDYMVRMDFLYSDGILYFNEVNTIPGALSCYYFSDFKGIMKKLITKSLMEKQKDRQIINHFNINVLSGIKK